MSADRTTPSMTLDEFCKYMRRPHGPTVPPSDPFQIDADTELAAYARWCRDRRSRMRGGQ